MITNIAGAAVAFVLVFSVALILLETGRLAPKKPRHSVGNKETKNEETAKDKKSAENKKPAKNKEAEKKLVVAGSSNFKSSGTGVNLLITRKEIAEYARSLGNEHITVSEHRDIQIPVTLKWKKRTFAMLYAADDGILAVVALDKKTAEIIKESHPDLHKPAFPKGAHWYGLTINNLTFDSKQTVYDLLDLALEYVESMQK